MRDLGTLPISAQAPLTREQVQQLPAGMIVWRRLMCQVEEGFCRLCQIEHENPWRLYQIVTPATTLRSPECRQWLDGAGWSESTVQLGAEVEVRYPKLPRLSVRLTEAAVRERRKTVTRRLGRPAWCAPGRLVLLVDRIRQGEAIGLAVVEVVSVRREVVAQINAAEVALEGLDMTPAEFSSFFTKEMRCTPQTPVLRIEWRYL